MRTCEGIRDLVRELHFASVNPEGTILMMDLGHRLMALSGSPGQDIRLKNSLEALQWMALLESGDFARGFSHSRQLERLCRPFGYDTPWYPEIIIEYICWPTMALDMDLSELSPIARPHLFNCGE